MKPLPFSWYFGTQEPRSLIIGPAGHNCTEWEELESVATPPDRMANPFYMEAEAACVMHRCNLVRVVGKVSAANEILWENIRYSVPGVPKHEVLFSRKYFIAQEKLRNEYLTQTNQ